MYNDLTDNVGTVTKTAGEVQACVKDLLCRLGTGTAFADQLATEFAAPGKAGNDLYTRLVQQVASLPPAPAAGSKPITAAMDLAADVIDEEASLFSMRESTKPGIDILGEVKDGELAFMVRAVLKGTGERGTLSGRYMFERMLAHFASVNTAINAIQGNWTYESNLDLFNRLVRVGLPPAQAAAGTITGQWAAQHGYTMVTDVVVEPSTAPVGAYTKATAKFRK